MPGGVRGAYRRIEMVWVGEGHARVRECWRMYLEPDATRVPDGSVWPETRCNRDTGKRSHHELDRRLVEPVEPVGVGNS